MALELLELLELLEVAELSEDDFCLLEAQLKVQDAENALEMVGGRSSTGE